MDIKLKLLEKVKANHFESLFIEDEFGFVDRGFNGETIKETLMSFEHEIIFGEEICLFNKIMIKLLPVAVCANGETSVYTFIIEG